MEASEAQCVLTTQDTKETITPRTTKGTMETPMQTDLSIKEETYSTTPRTHLVAGTTDRSQWI